MSSKIQGNGFFSQQKIDASNSNIEPSKYETESKKKFLKIEVEPFNNS